MKFKDLVDVELFFDDIDDSHYRTSYNNADILIEVREFPPNPVFTVYINGKEVYSNNDLPTRWKLYDSKCDKYF